MLNLFAISKPVIILAFANDYYHGTHLLNLVNEKKGIKDAVKQNPETDRFELEILDNATPKDIFDTLQKPYYRDRIEVFHYGGHAEIGELLLQNEKGLPQSVYANGIATFLKTLPNLKLVFLNGCSTFGQVKALMEGEQGIQNVIATSRPIDDQKATDFALRFYKGLAGGAHIDTAFKQAKGAVETTGKASDIRSVTVTRDYFRKGKESVKQKDFEWILYQKQRDIEGCGLKKYLLINRSKQVDNFCMRVEDKTEIRPKQAQFYVLHGDLDEGHSSLVERFSDIELPEIVQQFQTNLRFHHKIPEEFPYFGEMEVLQRSLKTQVAKEFDLASKGRHFQAADILQLHHLRQGVVIIEHFIDCRHWNDNTSKLIAWYIHDFWKASIDFSLPYFIVFFNVKYQEVAQKRGFFSRFFKKKDDKFKIQKELQHIARLPNIQAQFTLLPELTSVGYNDFSHWIERVGNLDFMYLMDELFADKNVQLPMQKALYILKKAMEKMKEERDSKFRRSL